MNKVPDGTPMVFEEDKGNDENVSYIWIPVPFTFRELVGLNYVRFYVEKLCKNCKYWDTSTMEWANNYHDCSNSKCLEAYDHRDDSMDCILYPEGWNSAPRFGPDFGCIHWECKGDDKI